MIRVEVNNVEYGECTVLVGKNKSMLMVDCGSINNRLRSPAMEMPQVFRLIAEKYSTMVNRQFLLTHYHRDHLCGFLWILREKGEYFNRVYLPFIPRDKAQNSPLLDFGIFAKVFLSPNTDCAQLNTSCLNVFWQMTKYMDGERIFTVKSGDVINFDQESYEILNPSQNNFEFGSLFQSGVEDINIWLSNPYLPEFVNRFMALKKRFVALYYRCQEAFSGSNRQPPQLRLSLCEQLHSVYTEIKSLSPQLNSLPVARDIRQLMEGQPLRSAYSEAVNAASVVFHNIRNGAGSNQDILMTGDITTAAFENLYSKLYPNYFIIKAAHHGTESGYSSVLKDIGVSHILISSGDYKAGGEISPSYQAMEAVKHCTGGAKCKWLQTTSSCCNRLNYCFDISGKPELMLKCPQSGRTQAENGCKIYVAAPNGSRGCFCD